MGSSLTVYPFAAIVDYVEEETPIVLINRENPGLKRKDNFIFLEGDLDDNIYKLCEDSGINIPNVQKIVPKPVDILEGI